MMLDQIRESFWEAVLDTNRDRALDVVRRSVRRGVSPEEIVFEVVIPVLEQRGASVATTTEMNLAQHFVAAQIAAEVTDEMIPEFAQAPETAGRAIIGTAVGDLHSLGKRIVTGCLKARMIDTVDLGVNVDAERFVDAAVAHRAQVIAVSAMMLHTARGENGAVKVRQVLKERGLEQSIRLVVGGAPYRFDKNLYKVVQADAWAEDGLSGAQLIANLAREVAR